MLGKLNLEHLRIMLKKELELGVQNTTIMSQSLLNKSIADHSNAKDPTRRLKVAYVSPDLNGTHAGINYNLGEMLFCRFP